MPYYILYKTTLEETGEYYIGIHAAKKLHDSYLGSGSRLKQRIQQYGRKAFKREILQVFESELEMRYAEMDMVNEELLADPLCLNIAPGGGGEFERQLLEDLRRGNNETTT